MNSLFLLPKIEFPVSDGPILYDGNSFSQ
uniref:Uncharacterized protein n=1 Tax=Anguilla anguilla TaxID=7936 RepID=A0A0E9Q3B6_ANGAN